jgi:signal transduction histidine kinase
VSHELKTPLNRLKMTIEEAANRSEKGLAVDDQLAEALAESDQINGTFEALLRISQIEAGARKTRFAPVDLAGVMTSVAEIYAEVAEDSGHHLKLAAMTPQPAIISGDRELLTQLFVNLVENAINHCPAGTCIGLSLSWSNGLFVSAVSDSGPGIPHDEREKVFRRLYRLDKSRTTPGSGLGLSLVRAVSELHSGHLEVIDNSPGLTISLTFPELPHKHV